jgi:hypothetical protein
MLRGVSDPEPWIPDPDAEEARWRTELFLSRCDVPDAAGAVDLAQRTGILSAAEAAEWRARVAADAPLVRTRPVNGLSARARDRLEWWVGELERTQPGEADDAYGEISALRQAGALTAAEAVEWEDRMSRAIGAETAAEFAELVAPFNVDRGALLRVAVGPEPSGDLRVVEVRVYEGRIVVRYVLSNAGSDERWTPDAVLRDDTGLWHRPADGFSQGGGGVQEGEEEFVDPLPAEARRLFFSIGADEVEIHL